MLDSILNILFGIFFLYCALSVIYLFILAIAGKFFYRNMYANGVIETKKKIAVLVPAYKEDGIIFSTANSLLQLVYPKDMYDVYIIADSFQQQTLADLRQLSIHVFEVSFDKSTKTKSLNEAFSRIDKEYDIALICDADNMLAKDFLQKINNAFVQGARALQGRRVAKNLDTSFAILDACSEGINNNIFRKGTNAIGISSSVIGSGMAFEFDRIKNVLSQINAVGGFDKPLQLKIVQQGIKIQYLEDALVFDEKVDSSHAFKQQRKRWVSSQFIYLKQFFFPAFKELFKGNVSYFNLAIANNIILPRAFLFMAMPLLVLIAFFISKTWLIASACLWILYFITIALALPSELINKDLLHAILKLPKAIGIMFGTLFQMKKSNKTFIHTVHTKTEINNPLFNEHSK
jgi:cellulose synthase/poly-beta-1,6-N-acetylglucosamine synthase-like glycosyltransferase